MIEIKEVKTKKEQKRFLNFPLKLYKHNPYFAPPLYGDEKKIFRKDFVYNDTCEHIYFNAYMDGKMAGRISGIIQRASNEIRNEKRVRFTRFDSIDNIEVARALFAAVEDWAKKKGMNAVVGPLNFSDLEREGLLVEGFDQLSTFEEQYNYEYYGKLIEACGYRKEVDWLESRLTPIPGNADSLDRMAQFVMNRYDLHFGRAKNVNDFLKRYGDAFFELLDRAYADIYGAVPFTDGMKQMMYANFKLIIDLKHVALILDKNERVVCLGICFSSLARAMQKSSGRLTPAGIVRVLHAIKHPDIIDLGLIAVDPEYINKGVATVVLSELNKMLCEPGIKWAETNLNLEDNHAILNSWKRFNAVQHKRRRSYLKVLEEGVEQ